MDGNLVDRIKRGLLFRLFGLRLDRVAYLFLIWELKRYTLVNTEEVYKYWSDDFRKSFLLYFKFAQENLLLNESRLNIVPSRIYFRNDNSVNAVAGKSGNYFLIKINKGIISTLFNFYTGKQQVFFQHPFKRFQTLDTILDISPAYLMFQIATLFTFYHEKGHLIQQNDNGPKFFQESYSINFQQSQFSLIDHVHEFDADLYASHFCAMHLINYWERLRNDLQTREILSDLITVGTASIFVYFIFLSEGQTQIYYKNGDHPHPLIRLTYLVDHVLKSAEANIPLAISLNVAEIIRNVILLSEAMFTLNGDNKVEGYGRMFLEENARIVVYVNELIAEMDHYPNLCRHKNID